jgi:hypothetical protein
MMQYSGRPTMRQFEWSALVAEVLSYLSLSLFVQFRRDSLPCAIQQSSHRQEYIVLLVRIFLELCAVFIYASTAVPEHFESCRESVLKLAQHFEKI